MPGDSFRLEFYTSNYQTNTPCGVVYGYYLVKGNKATDDWRPSLNDTKKAIAAAQAAADQAKEDAAASAQKLEDWSSDELISPPEKPGLVQQKADIAGIPLYMPRIDLCTDNAAMIGSAAYYRYRRGEVADLTLNAVPGLRLL